jgi:2-oxoglutarate ferredoxin oxidoreductase subunit gamma
MSHEAYVKFAPELSPKGMMLIEQDMVRITNIPDGVKVYGIPATRIAEELGKRMVLNIVMVGFFGAITGVLSREALRDAVADSVPKAFVELNMKAFDAGFEYGEKHLKDGALDLRADAEMVAPE